MNVWEFLFWSVVTFQVTLITVYLTLVLTGRYENKSGLSVSHNTSDDTTFDSKTPQNMVTEFHDAFEISYGLNPRNINLRRTLISEEYNEVMSELYALSATTDTNRESLAKELADLLYVLYGTAVTLGIDLDESFSRVHKSNMSKLGDDGLPVRRDDGKVLKSDNYEPPEMEGVVYDTLTVESQPPRNGVSRGEN